MSGLCERPHVRLSLAAELPMEAALEQAIVAIWPRPAGTRYRCLPDLPLGKVMTMVTPRVRSSGVRP